MQLLRVCQKLWFVWFFKNLPINYSVNSKDKRIFVGALIVY